jgi:thiol-disulfide isomerase/thioredoxin
MSGSIQSTISMFANSVTVIYIGAKWCSTCKTIKPAVEQLTRRFGVELKVLDYDTDFEEGDGKDAITKVPTLRLQSGGVQMAEWNVGQVASLEAWLQANVAVAMVDEDF